MVTMKTTMQQFYTVIKIYKKLIYKGYGWALPTKELKNEQNVCLLPPADFVYKNEHSGGKGWFIALPLVSST